MENIFSKNLIACLMNQTSQEDRLLHLAAVKTVSSIEKVAQEHPEVIPTVVKHLVGRRGSYIFDQMTGRKTVARCLQNANLAVAECLSVLRKPLMKMEQSDTTNAPKYLLTYANYLAKLAPVPTSAQSVGYGNKKAEETEGPTTAVIKELATFAYSSVEHPIVKAALTSSVRDEFRAKLEKVLCKLVRKPADSIILCEAVRSINVGAIEMEEPLSEACSKARKTMDLLLKKEHEVTDGMKSVIQGLLLLYAGVISQLYAQDNSALETLKDLTMIVEKMEVASSRVDEAEIPDGLPTFLVETLLSLLARKSALTRQVCVIAFEAFTGMMDRDALQTLVDTLYAEENEKGYRALFVPEVEADMAETDTDGDEDEDSSYSDGCVDKNESEDKRQNGDACIIEVDSDIDFEALEDDSDAEQVLDDEEGDGESSAEKTKSGKNYVPNSTASAENLAALDAALAKLLNSRPLDQDAGDGSSSSSSPSEDDMSDGEMMKLDEKLAEVFRQRLGHSHDGKNYGFSSSSEQKEKIKHAREAKEMIINLKRRVLDLLETYLRTRTLNPLSFELLAPLLASMQATQAKKAVAARAAEVIEIFGGALKRERKRKKEGCSSAFISNAIGAGELLDRTLLKETLKAVHDEAARDEGTHALASAASKASLSVAATLVKLEAAGGGGDEENEGDEGDLDVEKRREKEELRFIDGLYEDIRRKREAGETRLRAEFDEEYWNWRQTYTGNGYGQVGGAARPGHGAKDEGGAGVKPFGDGEEMGGTKRKRKKRTGRGKNKKKAKTKNYSGT